MPMRSLMTIATATWLAVVLLAGTADARQTKPAATKPAPAAQPAPAPTPAPTPAPGAGTPTTPAPAPAGAPGDPATDPAAPVPTPDTPPPTSGALSHDSLSRRLENVHARTERARARVGMLKDAVLRGGPGATANIVHLNKMTGQFRLVQVIYTIDGTRILAQRDESGQLHDKKTINVLNGPIAPGSHTIGVSLLYRGHGYGPFKYLNKQTFPVQGSFTFDVAAGKTIRVEVLGFERTSGPLEQRPSVSFKESAAN
jgi:hypothetical protein